MEKIPMGGSDPSGQREREWAVRLLSSAAHHAGRTTHGQTTDLAHSHSRPLLRFELPVFTSTARPSSTPHLRLNSGIGLRCSATRALLPPALRYPLSG